MSTDCSVSSFAHKSTQEILNRVTIMAYDHRFPPFLAGITFRELMSAIFHAQDPRNRRVKWFAVNLSSTWPPLPPRDAHLVVSHNIFQFCIWKRKQERKREKQREGDEIMFSPLYLKGHKHSCEHRVLPRAACFPLAC